MWKRKDLKRRARQALKANYLAAVGVCFIMMMFIGQYQMSKQAIVNYNPRRETTSVVVEPELHTSDNFSILQNIVGRISNRLDEKRADDPTYATQGVLSGLVNSMTQEGGSLFKVFGLIDSFVHHQVPEGFMLLISFVLSWLVSVFIYNLIIVGERRFFMESRLYTDTQIRRLFFLFKQKQLIRPAKVMLVRQLKLFLWACTIVMYPVKCYEYAMIPYLVAENPELSVKAAFSLSKQMMHHNKWNLFVMDLSYWYWHLLNLLSFGVMGIFFLNPYRRAAETELYMDLRKEYIYEQYPYYQELNDPYIAKRPIKKTEIETMEEQELEDTMELPSVEENHHG